MDAVITTLGTAIGAEALKSWGVFAIVIVLLGLRLWHQSLELKAEKAENKDLRAVNQALQDKRLEDVQKLIRVAETGTATMAARADGDQRFLQAISGMADAVSENVSTSRSLAKMIEEFKDRLPPPPRRPSRRRESQ